MDAGWQMAAARHFSTPRNSQEPTHKTKNPPEVAAQQEDYLPI